MHLPIDILSCIFNHLDDYDIFRLCQVDKFFSQLQRKDKLWSLVWNDRYKDNIIISELTLYQNFKRLTLVKKFLELNSELFWWQKNHIHHSGTPKRFLYKAVFIPIVGFNHEDNNDRRVLPPSMKYAFASVNVRLPHTPLDWDGDEVKFVNWLLSTDNLFIKPRVGDILAFVELGGDRVDNLLIYDGKKIDHCWPIYTSSYPFLLDTSWPEIPIDFWHTSPVVPSEIKQQWIQNMKYGPLPSFLQFDHLNPNFYSFGSIEGKILYLVFDRDFTDIQMSKFDDMWYFNTEAEFNDAFREEIGEINVMIRAAESKNGIEYIIFGDPDA